MPTVATEWADVVAQMTSFLALDIVTAGLAVVIGLPVLVMFIRTVRRAITSRR